MTDREKEETVMASGSDVDRHGVPRCGGKKKQGEGTCTQAAGWGTDHPGFGRCKLHGGCTPNQVVAAERQVAEAEVRRVLAELSVEPVSDPLTGLMKLAGQVVAWQEATAGLVNRLESVRYRGANGAEQLRAEVILYERAMDRAVTVLAAIGRLNIDERLAKVTEQQVSLMVAAVNAALVAAGLSVELQLSVKREVARELRGWRVVCLRVSI
jgi:hypothetical protein